MVKQTNLSAALPGLSEREEKKRGKKKSVRRFMCLPKEAFQLLFQGDGIPRVIFVCCKQYSPSYSFTERCISGERMSTFHSVLLIHGEFEKQILVDIIACVKVFSARSVISTRGMGSFNIESKTISQPVILTRFTAAEFSAFTCSLAECV